MWKEERKCSSVITTWKEERGVRKGMAVGSAIPVGVLVLPRGVAFRK